MINTINRFKDKGYETGLAYLGLRSIGQSIDRVTERVSDGGHFVDNGSIRYSYNEGLKNLIYFAGRFDHLEFIDASGNLQELKSLLSVQNKELVFVADQPPVWAAPAIADIAVQFRPRSPERHHDNEIRRGPRR